jgi:hypothetical protein
VIILWLWFASSGEEVKKVKKLSWVSWDSMTMPKYRCRMVFKNIEVFNLALLVR